MLYIVIYLHIKYFLLFFFSLQRCIVSREGALSRASVCPTLPLAEMDNPPAIIRGCQHQFLLLLRCLWAPHSVETEGPVSHSAAIIFHYRFWHPFGPPTLKWLQLFEDLSPALSKYRTVMKMCAWGITSPWCHMVNEKEDTVSHPPRTPKGKAELYISLTRSDPQHIRMWRSQRGEGGRCSKPLLWVSRLSSSLLIIFFLSRESAHGGRAENSFNNFPLKFSVICIVKLYYCY